MSWQIQMVHVGEIRNFCFRLFLISSKLSDVSILEHAFSKATVCALLCFVITLCNTLPLLFDALSTVWKISSRQILTKCVSNYLNEKHFLHCRIIKNVPKPNILAENDL